MTHICTRRAGWAVLKISTLTTAAGLEGFGLSHVWVGVRLSPSQPVLFSLAAWVRWGRKELNQTARVCPACGGIGCDCAARWRWGWASGLCGGREAAEAWRGHVDRASGCRIVPFLLREAQLSPGMGLLLSYSTAECWGCWRTAGTWWGLGAVPVCSLGPPLLLPSLQLGCSSWREGSFT